MIDGETRKYRVGVLDLDDDRKQVTATIDPHFALEHGLDPNEQYMRLVGTKECELFEHDYQNAKDDYERGASLREFFQRGDAQ